MKNAVLRSIDAVTALLAVLIVGMIVTGGTIARFGHAKIEFAAVDAWMLGLGVLLLARSTASPVVRAIERTLDWARKPSRSKKVAAALCLAVFGACFIGYVLKMLSFHTHGFDAGYVNQALFYPFGKPLLKADLSTNQSYLGTHLAFSLFIPALVTAYWHSATFITLFKVLCVALPVWFLVTRGPLKDAPALLLPALLILLCHRALRDNLLFDFREDQIAFAGLTLALVALVRRNWIGYALALALALASKENYCIIVPFMAIPILFDQDLGLTQRERKWAAAGTALFGLIYAVLAFTELMPHFLDSTGTTNITGRLGAFGSTPKEILLTLLTSPRAWWKVFKTQLLTRETIQYLVFLLGPFLYFSRKSWFWLIPALPGIAMNLVSASPAQRSLHYHYDLIILPFLAFALLQGIYRSRSKLAPSRAWVLPIFIALTLSGRWPGGFISSYWPSWDQIIQSRYLDQIPNEGIVATDVATWAHLAQLHDLRPVTFLDEPVNPVFASFGLPDRAVLDQSDSRSHELTEHLIQEGCRVISQDPTARFVYIDLACDGRRP